MSLTPLSLTKTRFRRSVRGYDTAEVEEFLELAAAELARVLGEVEKLKAELERSHDRLRQSETRERELQETLLRAQRVSDEILANAQREAQLLVKEAEMTADKIVQQAIDRVQGVERRIAELQHRRRELHGKLKTTVDLYAQILEAEADDEERRASIHKLPRKGAGETRQGGA